MRIETLPVGPLDTNCYVVIVDSSSSPVADQKKEAIVIDPGDEASVIFDVIEKNNLDVKLVLITHAHWDHIGAVAEIAKKTGAKIAAHPLDIPALNKPDKNLASLLGESLNAQIKVDIELEDGQIIKVGDQNMQIMHTPGHSRGSVSVLIDDSLFTGDLIFYRSIGRTDFEGGSLSALKHSVNEKVFKCDDSVIIYPGHGPATTVGDERKDNPYFV